MASVLFLGVMSKNFLSTLAVVLLLVSPALAERSREGVASWYGPGFYGHTTSNGEKYTGRELTAACNDYPLDSTVRITNQENHHSVLVRITDHGGFKKYHRLIDVSPMVANKLGFKEHGLTNVKVHLVEKHNSAHLAKHHNHHLTHRTK